MSNAPPPWPDSGSQPSYGPAGYGQPLPRPNNPAIAALIVGILAVLGTITIIGGVVLGLVAVVLGGVGLSKSRELQRGRGQAIAGIVLGGLALLLSVGIVALGFIAYTEFSGNSAVPVELEYDGVGVGD